MQNSTLNLENARAPKPPPLGTPPGSAERAAAAAREKGLQRIEGMKIAQSAVRGIGMSTKEIRGAWMNNPDYALAVSLLFTRATNQTIMPGTEPRHVLSTALLYNSLLHDSRFMQVPMSQAAPGDIVIEATKNQTDAYAGIVVDHGRIISDNSNGVQNNSSLAEAQRHVPPMVLFRYIGVQRHPGYAFASLANAGFNPDEPRLPAGQPGGGQWTSGGTNGKAKVPEVAFGGRQVQNDSTTSGSQTTPDMPAMEFHFYAPAKKHAQPDSNQQPPKTAVTETEAVKALWAAVSGSIKAGGQHPTRAQLEQFSEAVDALQKYLVDHGMTPEEAFEAVYSAVHNLTHPGTGPNPGSEGVFGARQGQTAGADIGQIFAGIVLGRSNVPDKDSNASPPSNGGASEKRAGDGLEVLKEPGVNNPSRPNYNAVKWVQESPRMMGEDAAAYQEGAPASRYGMAPQLSAVDSNGNLVTAKFDGVDARTGEMVDRKTSIVTTDKSLEEARRQSFTAQKNGFGVRWDVPNAASQARAQKFLSKNGIQNIKVAVAPR